MTGKIDNGEQEVADLGAGGLTVAGRQLRLDLVRLLANLGKDRARIVPVEPDLAGLGLQLERPGEGRERDRDAGKGTRDVRSLTLSLVTIGLPSLFLGLDPVPQPLDAFRRKVA